MHAVSDHEGPSQVVRRASRRGIGGARALGSGVVLALAAAALLLGCAHRGTGGEGDARNAEVALEVQSHNWSDVVIYLVRGGGTERIGMVSALTTRTFVLPFRRLGTGADVRLRAYPIGGPAAFTSENLYIQPGQFIKWTLENELSRSFVSVY